VGGNVVECALAETVTWTRLNAASGSFGTRPPTSTSTCRSCTITPSNVAVSPSSYDIGEADTALRYRALIAWPDLHRLAETIGVDLRFERADTLSLTIEPTDLLFIDTYHVYEQLRAELDRHGLAVRKYIVMHDTEAFGARGEDGSEPGLWAAVERFLVDHSEWCILERLSNNNGLTVLGRTPTAASTSVDRR